MTWVLLGNRKRDQGTTEQTTGHAADGIEEYDNPLPAWWFYMFLITIIWGALYLVIYPGLGDFPGLINWTQEKQYEQQVAAADKKYRDMRDRYLALPIEEIASDPKVRKMGMRMFSNNCAQCHGGDAKGSYGFPNLADKDWIWGGSPEQIKASINTGRRGTMPGWGQIIGDQGVAESTAYVLTLNGREADSQLAEAGAAHFQTYCSACHGANGEGNSALGSPNLANGIWLYGGTQEQLSHSIRAGRSGEMPAHNVLLSEDKIHILTAYVYGLSQ
jgi:cytochrome c oxidase cbb3-type subunit 3